MPFVPRVYGIALGGWASNSKYSLLGGIRGAAQMISHELSLGLSLVPVVMLARSFSLVTLCGLRRPIPFILVQPLAFVIFVISAMAESKRILSTFPKRKMSWEPAITRNTADTIRPLLPGEYVNMQVLGALVAVLFLGGWSGPFLPGPAWLCIKILVVALIMIWIRGTLPRLGMIS